jgi:hypothetical protein
MKIYTVLFAQDIPHYGSVQIEAKDDADALRQAKRYWRDVQMGAEPWPLHDAQYDSAVSARIVLIYDEADDHREIAHDVRLDDYKLLRARTARHERTLDNAQRIFKTLERVMQWWQNTPHADDDEMPAALFDKAQALIAKVKGGAA